MSSRCCVLYHLYVMYVQRMYSTCTVLYVHTIHTTHHDGQLYSFCMYIRYDVCILMWTFYFLPYPSGGGTGRKKNRFKMEMIDLGSGSGISASFACVRCMYNTKLTAPIPSPFHRLNYLVFLLTSHRHRQFLHKLPHIREKPHGSATPGPAYVLQQSIEWHRQQLPDLQVRRKTVHNAARPSSTQGCANPPPL